MSKRTKGQKDECPEVENTTPQEIAPDNEISDPVVAELKKAREELAELGDRYVRVLAEYDNFKKRSQKEREALFPEAKAVVLTGLLPVLDNMERGVAAQCADAEYKKGMEMVYQSLLDTLAKLGVEQFGEAGDTFDPTLHNAVMHVEDEAYPDGSVCEVFQTGFKMGDRVLRHAMVKVAN